MSNSFFKRPQLNKTKSLRHQNAYTLALHNEFKDFTYDEESGHLQQGRWRETMGLAPQAPLDLEIGLGNGLHFAHLAQSYPERGIIGVELKYKPLIQSIRRALNQGAKFVRAMRYHAFNLDLCFASQELNNIYVHFPDPWTSPRKPDNRILNPRMIHLLCDLQRPGSTLFFKTDSQEAFEWCLEHFYQSPFNVTYVTRDLHRSEKAEKNFVTQFESIFIRKGLPIYYLEAVKPLPAHE